MSILDSRNVSAVSEVKPYNPKLHRGRASWTTWTRRIATQLQRVQLHYFGLASLIYGSSWIDQRSTPRHSTVRSGHDKETEELLGPQPSPVLDFHPTQQSSEYYILFSLWAMPPLLGQVLFFRITMMRRWNARFCQSQHGWCHYSCRLRLGL